MASSASGFVNEFETLDDEVRELLLNYKQKKATTYEPCTYSNYKECLIGLSEELNLLNINYIFNPYADLEEGTLTVDALVKLVNSVWTLLHIHKNTAQNAERSSERTHVLENTNKQLNVTISRLKEKLGIEQNKAMTCVMAAQRVSDCSDSVQLDLIETRAKLTQVTKQKETKEKSLQHEITRLKRENEKLLDRLRGKSDSYTPCDQVCDSTIIQLKERERKQRAMINQLQSNNQELLREVLAMKEELILGGFHDFKIQDRKP